MWVDRIDRDLTWKQIHSLWDFQAVRVCMWSRLYTSLSTINVFPFAYFDILAVHGDSIVTHHTQLCGNLIWNSLNAKMYSNLLCERNRTNEQMNKEKKNISSDKFTRTHIVQCTQYFQQMTKTSNSNNVDWLLMHKILSLSNPKYSKVWFSIVSAFFHINFSFSDEQILTFPHVFFYLFQSLRLGEH